jgi:hypothetical protein
MKGWLDGRPLAAWFFTGLLVGLALLLLIFEERRDRSDETGAQSYYSQF